MKSCLKLYPVAIICAALLLACVKSEKRTTKNVDASKVQVYQYDPSKPDLRLALEFPEDLRAGMAERLYVEIDDGVNRYGVPGTAFAPDSASGGTLYSPKINTPDSGRVGVKFQLLGSGGESAAGDSLSMDLRPDQSWQVIFVISGEDMCEREADMAECRSYLLNSGAEKENSRRLFMIWRSQPIMSVSDQ